jgi:hypothetical protein
MSKKIPVVIVAAVLCGLLLTTAVLAMSSENYRLDWFTPLAGSGGVDTSSSYTVNFTVGQTVIGESGSPDYEACLGYWCSVALGRTLYLPIIFNNYSHP